MQSIEDICNEYTKVVYRYLFCITRNKEIAEDLTQETLYKAIKNIDKFRGECKINLWLCKIARNEWLMYLKKQKKVEKIPINEAIAISEDIEVEEKIIDMETKNNIYKEIQNLDEETAQIIFLRIEEELSFKEIGKMFNKNETWARVKFFRGKEKIKEKLGNEELQQRL